MRIDPQCPHLPMALQPTLMQELLQRALLDPLDNEEQRLQMDACVIGEKRYKPGQSCVLSYRLHLHDARTDAKHEQVVSARLCRPDEGQAEFHRARSRQLVRTPGVRALAYIPEIEMVIWSFPNDRKLSHLPKLLDVERLKTCLPEKLRALGVGESHVGLGPLRVRRRLLVLVGLQLTPPDGDLFGVRPRERDGRSLRVDLFGQRRNARPGRVVRGPERAPGVRAVGLDPPAGGGQRNVLLYGIGSSLRSAIRPSQAFSRSLPSSPGTAEEETLTVSFPSLT